MVLACALALPGIAFASDHGPVFSYATPVNSQGEVSCDVGLFGRNGSKGSQLSIGTGCGYGITPHITVNVFLPPIFGSGSLPESRIFPGSEWSAGASWRFLHSITSVGKRIESTASLGVVVPGPQQDSGVLAGIHRAPGVAGSLATGLASRRTDHEKDSRSAALVFSTLAAHAEYQQVNLTVFGMDCAPCAHAIHVSMKDIQA